MPREFHTTRVLRRLISCRRGQKNFAQCKRVDMLTPYLTFRSSRGYAIIRYLWDSAGAAWGWICLSSYGVDVGTAMVQIPWLMKRCPLIWQSILKEAPGSEKPRRNRSYRSHRRVRHRKKSAISKKEWVIWWWRCMMTRCNINRWE